MRHSTFSYLQETVWAVTAFREACDRAQCELMEIRAIAWEGLAKSRDLMAEIDTAITPHRE
jgi:hypothetical protein